MAPNHTADNGDSITIAELQKLALGKCASCTVAELDALVVVMW